MKRLRPFTAILLTLFLSFSSSPSRVSAENFRSYRIQLDSRFIDEVGYLVPHIMTYSADERLMPSELVRAIPGGYVSADTVFWSFQHRQYIYTQYRQNPKMRALIDQEYPDYFSQSHNNYTDSDIDGVLTFCLLEDSEGNEFIVFDSNNDEDLTNDAVHPVDTRNSQTIFTHYPDFSITTDIETEIFDGEAVQTITIPLYFSKLNDGNAPSRFALQIRTMPAGIFILDNQEYRLGVVPAGAAEFDLSREIWVDSNLNGYYDRDDLVTSMHSPLTIGTRVYKVSEIDRNGTSLSITETDLPPLAKGMTAPDFQSQTVAGTGFSLSKLRGRLVLVNFWSTRCEPCLSEIPNLRSTYEQFGGDRFEIVSIGIGDEPSILKDFATTNRLPWTHLAVMNGAPLLELYQVSKYPATFLISPDGILLDRNSPSLRGTQLLQTVAVRLGEIQ